MLTGKYQQPRLSNALLRVFHTLAVTTEVADRQPPLVSPLLGAHLGSIHFGMSIGSV